MKDGEYIELHWQDRAEFEAVRGWIGEEMTRKVVEGYACNTATRKWSFRECYAANLQTATCRENGYDYEVQLFATPARGRYKVSVLEPLNPSGLRTAHTEE